MAKDKLQLVTWNCNGALRKKWHALTQFDADLLVVQECEDPAQAKDTAYLAWAGHHLWTGPTKNKGIGVFARNGVELQRVELDLGTLQMFLPCLVDDWPLLATWTTQANSPTFGYVGQLWKLLQEHKGFVAHPFGIVIGDLNSNARWDKWDRWWNHSDVVRELAEVGLESAYHRHFSEAQGAESRPTLFLQRKLEKSYHIDYAFLGSKWSVESVVVGESEPWLQLSDHMPLTVELRKAGR